MLRGVKTTWTQFFLTRNSPWTQKLNVHKPFRRRIRLLMYIQYQGFIRAILMSGRRHKKLNFLIEFSNSIFIKFCFKPYWRWTSIQNKLAYNVSSILSYLSSRCKKRPNFFRGFTLLKLHQCPGINLLQSLQHFENLTCIWQHSKTRSLLKNGQ